MQNENLWSWSRCEGDLVEYIFEPLRKEMRNDLMVFETPLAQDKPAFPRILIFWIYTYRQQNAVCQRFRFSSWTFITLWANSADDKFMNCFLIFSHKTGFDISRKLLISAEDNLHRKSYPVEIICMKCRHLFQGNKKNTSKCHLLKVLYSVLISLKTFICQNKLIVVWK